MDEHAFASITRLAAEIRDHRIGFLELLDLYLARAERHNPAFNAIIAKPEPHASFGAAPPDGRDG